METNFSNLFTNNEFNFINNIDTNIKQYETQLKESQLNKNLLTNFINALSEAIYVKVVNCENYDEEKALLYQVEDIFKLINTNILILQENKEILNVLTKKIMDLQIKLESKQDISGNDYINEINTVKQDIADFINVSNTSIYTDNNNNILNFINSDVVKKYLEKYSNTQVTTTVSEKNVDSRNILDCNNVLMVSEKSNKVYLPYSRKEVLEYIEKYPEQYNSFEDVIQQEFIYPLDFYLKHPAVARFRETYYLIRDREAKSVLDALKFAMSVMFNYGLTPTIIAACKSQAQLENYLDCLSRNRLDEFKDFEIKFEMSPIKI